MIKTRRQAFAEHCGFDLAETEDYRYHYGRTSLPVYAMTDCYYCVTKGAQRPAKHRDGMDWNWKEVINPYVNKFGWKIWQSLSN